jgi:CHAT domain-containing protein
VVLSACETGLGKTAGGEGVLGLQRAFQVAGAKTCITSLWKVDDTATQLLLIEFYKNLWEKKLPKLDALRDAQLVVLKRYDPVRKRLLGPDVPEGAEHASPFYWAAFVLSGDWR